MGTMEAGDSALAPRSNNPQEEEKNGPRLVQLAVAELRSTLRAAYPLVTRGKSDGGKFRLLNDIVVTAAKTPEAVQQECADRLMVMTRLVQQATRDVSHLFDVWKQADDLTRASNDELARAKSRKKKLESYSPRRPSFATDNTGAKEKKWEADQAKLKKERDTEIAQLTAKIPIREENVSASRELVGQAEKDLKPVEEAAMRTLDDVERAAAVLLSDIKGKTLPEPPSKPETAEADAGSAKPTRAPAKNDGRAIARTARADPNKPIIQGTDALLADKSAQWRDREVDYKKQHGLAADILHELSSHEIIRALQPVLTGLSQAEQVRAVESVAQKLQSRLTMRENAYSHVATPQDFGRDKGMILAIKIGNEERTVATSPILDRDGWIAALVQYKECRRIVEDLQSGSVDIYARPELATLGDNVRHQFRQSVEAMLPEQKSKLSFPLTQGANSGHEAVVEAINEAKRVAQLAIGEYTAGLKAIGELLIQVHERAQQPSLNRAAAEAAGIKLFWSGIVGRVFFFTLKNGYAQRGISHMFVGDIPQMIRALENTTLQSPTMGTKGSSGMALQTFAQLSETEYRKTRSS